MGEGVPNGRRSLWDGCPQWPEERVQVQQGAGGGEPHMGVITWGHGVFSGLSANEPDHHSPRSAPMGELCSFYP